MANVAFVSTDLKQRTYFTVALNVMTLENMVRKCIEKYNAALPDRVLTTNFIEKCADSNAQIFRIAHTGPKKSTFIVSPSLRVVFYEREDGQQGPRISFYEFTKGVSPPFFKEAK